MHTGGGFFIINIFKKVSLDNRAQIMELAAIYIFFKFFAGSQNWHLFSIFFLSSCLKVGTGGDFFSIFPFVLASKLVGAGICFLVSKTSGMCDAKKNT